MIQGRVGVLIRRLWFAKAVVNVDRHEFHVADAKRVETGSNYLSKPDNHGYAR